MELGEIQSWIEENREMYEGALKIIRQALINFHHRSPEGRSMIYRVASRGDYQHGFELKTVQSIRGKLEKKWAGGRVLDEMISRSGMGKEEVFDSLRRNDLDGAWLQDMISRKKIIVTERGEGNIYTTTPEVRDKLKGYTIYTMEDIIGCKIVCIYPQDVDKLAECMNTNKIGAGEFTVDSEEVVIHESGYRAHHFTVRPALPAYYACLCEIQLVTMLHETWAFKTHELTYKGNVKPEYRKEARLLSDALRVVDDQSELLMKLTTEKRHIENQRREVCKQNLFKAILERSVRESSDMEPIARTIQEQADQLSYGQVSHVLTMLANYSKVHGVDFHFCRAMGLLATLRRDNDLDDMALHYADRLIVESVKGKARARIFKGLLYYCFDRMDKAIAVTQDTIKIADEEANTELRVLARQNLAYYIADAEKASLEEEGKGALEQARELLESDETLKASSMTVDDTLGYYKITFGRNFEEVEAGWRLCREATREHPIGFDVAQSYLRIHQARALSRMLELTR